MRVKGILEKVVVLYTCYHEITFGTAEDINIEEMLCLGLSQRRFEIAMEAILDKFL